MDELRQIIFNDYERGFTALVTSAAAVVSEKDELFDHLENLIDSYKVDPSTVLLDAIEEDIRQSLKLGLITAEDVTRTTDIITNLRSRG